MVKNNDKEREEMNQLSSNRVIFNSYNFFSSIFKCLFSNVFTLVGYCT